MKTFPKLKSKIQNSNKLNLLFATILAASLTACNSGGGGSSGGGDGTGGGGSDLNLQSVATIRGLNGSFNPSCIYSYGTLVYLVKGDGSGTGLQLDTTTGQVTQTSGLSSINLSNGDQCLPNYQQLVWVNSGSPSVVNLFDPSQRQTVSVNLSQTGISGSDITKSGFSLAGSSTNPTIYANTNFLNNGTFGFSSFSGLNPTSYTQIDNSSYLNRDISRVLYGFMGNNGAFVQLIPTDTTNNIPAGFLSVQNSSGVTFQHISTFTDSDSNPINAMSTAWDYTSAGNGVIVTTGFLQPVLYKCTLATQYELHCDKTYTSTELTTKYRIMRILGGNANTLYFMGMDLSKSDIEIFSMPL